MYLDLMYEPRVTGARIRASWVKSLWIVEYSLVSELLAEARPAIDVGQRHDLRSEARLLTC